MVKIRPYFILSFCLMAFIGMIPFTADSAALVKPRLVIIDLPNLDLQKLSTDYPNLTRLVATGSTGLVRIPSLEKTRSSSYIQRVIGPALDKEYYFHLPLESTTTNVETILQYYRFYREQAGIIMITFGKTHFTDPEKAKSVQQKMGRLYDNLVSRIAAETNFRNTLLMIYSSHPPDQLTFMNSSLTPIVLKGLNYTQGILYTPSTRKAGILTLNDLRLIIRRFRNPKTVAMLSIQNIPGNWRTLAYNQHALIKNYIMRWPVLTGYGYLLLGVIFLFTGGLVFRFQRIYMRIFAWSFLYLLTIPAAFLLEALFDPLNWINITIFTFTISGILFLCAYFLSSKDLSKTLLIISFLTAGLVAMDGLLNGYYEHKSFLGYSVVAGARYYGIGNEYMGILLGSYIVGVALSLRSLTKWRRQFLWFAGLFICLILIHPCFGADVGGGITALTGLGITNYLWLKQPIRVREMTRLGLLTLFIFGFMGILDLYVYQSSMSHLGKLLLSVQKNGMGVFIDLVIRKLALNFHLIRSTPPALILIGALLTIPFLYRFPPSSIQRLTAKYPEIISGFAGLSITAFIGLLTNDSGIVSAAMTFLFGIGLIMVLIGELWNNSLV